MLWDCRRQISHALHGIIHDIDVLKLAAPPGQQSCPCTAVVPHDYLPMVRDHDTGSSHAGQ